MDIPSVNGYGDFEVEPYEEYIKRWPLDFTNFPECLVRIWVHRHWSDFEDYWLPNGALEWNYEKRIFTNDQILQIMHHGDWLDTLDFWGDELFKNKQRRETWLAQYMLENGTTPEPILVYENGGDINHPRGLPDEKFCLPYQLIEGHMRTAYLRGMIHKKYEKLQSQHEVWVAGAST
ncbi:MAG: hypothetical protein GXO84_09485 [Chlorobi bacterium]|nr:hypothetical protein [Chlorobiota bacterium]